jgi:hypothetical protein
MKEDGRMKRFIYFFVVAVFASSLFIPAFACEEKEKDEEWRKIIDKDDESDESIADNWREAKKKDGEDGSEDADAEWRKAMLKDDESDEAEADWREALEKDK